MGVAGTDGVGTKLKLAFELRAHSTIGIDLVAMSVNDIVTTGAAPLFFLDYFATSRLDVDLAEEVVKGIITGCKRANCQLLGGETAEMPGMYLEGEYDLSGFAVGAVKTVDFLDGSRVQAGDAIVALASTGLHSNGFSLVRKVLETRNVTLDQPISMCGGETTTATLGEILMQPTAIYVNDVLKVAAYGGLHAAAHITGGGLTENIPRAFPEEFRAEVNLGSWKIPHVCDWLRAAGPVEQSEMFRVTNMGVGMTLIVAPDTADAIVRGTLQLENAVAGVIGHIVKNDDSGPTFSAERCCFNEPR